MKKSKAKHHLCTSVYEKLKFRDKKKKIRNEMPDCFEGLRLCCKIQNFVNSIQKIWNNWFYLNFMKMMAFKVMFLSLNDCIF